MRSRRSWAVSTLGAFALVTISLIALRPQAAVLHPQRGAVQRVSSGPCTACMQLERENSQLKAQVATLTAEVKSLHGQLSTCNRKLIDSRGG